MKYNKNYLHIFNWSCCLLTYKLLKKENTTVLLLYSPFVKKNMLLMWEVNSNTKESIRDKILMKRIFTAINHLRNIPEYLVILVPFGVRSKLLSSLLNDEPIVSEESGPQWQSCKWFNLTFRRGREN